MREPGDTQPVNIPEEWMRERRSTEQATADRVAKLAKKHRDRLSDEERAQFAAVAARLRTLDRSTKSGA